MTVLTFLWKENEIMCKMISTLAEQLRQKTKFDLVEMEVDIISVLRVGVGGYYYLLHHYF